MVNVEPYIDNHIQHHGSINKINTERIGVDWRARMDRMIPNGMTNCQNHRKGERKTQTWLPPDRLDMHHVLSSCRRKSVSSPMMQAYADCSISCPTLRSGIKCLNHLLERIMIKDRGKKVDEVSMGTLIDIWSHPIGSGV